MKHRQIVHDIETLGVARDAAITNIGAVCIELTDSQPLQSRVVSTFYVRVRHFDAHDCLHHEQAGRSHDLDTKQWWEVQSSPARFEALLNPDRMGLTRALSLYAEWLTALDQAKVPIWGNGSDFDNVILQEAFRSTVFEWPYRRNRCLRTLRGVVTEAFPDIAMPEFPAELTRHHALHDAIHEANQLTTLLAAITARPA
ncbi:3'-5' exonuclease [Chitinimonas taiwanensis]|uniref:3'-5' exonuclease n=1 Tax=Chitinimonas taiwanensis TaxID=240412 RepID=UPI0035B041B5